MQTKIIFLIPYFGPFPWSFPFFLASCEWNKDFNFCFFTDNGFESDLPHVQVHKMNLEEFNVLASAKLSLKVEITKPYKLCDFKPAYGKILEDYLDGYDFWGPCDVDIVLGNLSHFINHDLLQNIEVYSGIKWFLSGPLSLFRNNEICNNLFRLSKDYIQVFTSSKVYLFDECADAWHYMDDHVNLLALQTSVESISHVLIKERENVRTHYSDSIFYRLCPKPVLISNGKVFSEEKEYALFHLLEYKNLRSFLIPDEVLISPYQIDLKGFAPSERIALKAP